MKNVATYSGHCQACGRLQKLPNGKLSLHGYKVTFGFFAGTCCGSKELPFETSCDLVKQFIVSATNQLANVGQQILNVTKPATEAKAWMNVRYENPKGRYYQGIYKWEVVTLSIEETPFAPGNSSGSGLDSYVTYKFTDSLGRVHGSVQSPVRGVNRYDAPEYRNASAEQLLLATATKFNRSYAQRVLENEALNLRNYIAWQTERVTNWAPAALLPVDAKDKKGFEPIEAV